MMLSFRHSLAAGVVGAILFILTYVQDPLGSGEVRSIVVQSFSTVSDVETSANSRNVEKDSSVVVYVDQSAPQGGGVATRFLLSKGNDRFHPITQHMLDGSWKEWTNSDDPFRFPFHRHSFTGNITAFDAETHEPIALNTGGMMDNRAAKHFTPLEMITFLPDLRTDDKTAYGPKSIGSLIERPIPFKVAALGMFGVSWIFTLAVFFATVGILLRKREKCSARIVGMLVGAIYAVLVFREMGAREARPDYGVLLVVCTVMWQKGIGKGNSISLDGEDSV
ncbi:hypothetical protein C8Q76DRAFT_699449 [Earliella scabrosa]|nr:hypothetical protein C8Q76DRAFT_699449 [Earliella scabrosa]